MVTTQLTDLIFVHLILWQLLLSEHPVTLVKCTPIISVGYNEYIHNALPVHETRVTSLLSLSNIYDVGYSD